MVEGTEGLMGLGFQNIDGAGRFSGDSRLKDAEQRLDALLERYEAGKLSETVNSAELKAIVMDTPDYIDGHAHLGHALPTRLVRPQQSQFCGRETLPAPSTGQR